MEKQCRSNRVLERAFFGRVLEYNQIKYCTVPLRYVRSNFKIIEEICERNKDRWKWFGAG